MMLHAHEWQPAFTREFRGEVIGMRVGGDYFGRAS